ncbi:MAG TPA: rod shape-determining protein MreD [Usitatibacter sp.]|nr:rod shape-determining protein MreD [Usitatibacter sp.]
MRPADLTPVARDVMKLPASAGLIFFSIVGAYMLSMLPWRGTWLLARPDFLLIVLLFWTVHEPRSIGQGIAFTLGLLMDVSDSMLLGQHAFAYVVATFGAQVLRVRIGSFHLPEQTLHVMGLTFMASLVMLLLNLLLGANFPGWAFLVSPFLTGLLWAPVNWLLYSPAVRRRRREAAT